MSIAILDYGLGNLYSINQACFHVGIDAKITTNKDDIKNAASKYYKNSNRVVLHYLPKPVNP